MKRVPRLGDLRVRTRLLAVIAIPLVVATVLGALRVSSSLDVAARNRQFHEVAQLARTGTTLVQQLQDERDVTVDPTARSAGKSLAAVREQTSALEERFLSESARLSQTGRLASRLAAVKEAFATLPEIRAEADQQAPGSDTDTNYLGLIMSLLGIDNELDGQLTQSHSQGWGLYTLSLSTSMLSSERALMSQAVKSGQLTPAQRASLLATVKIRDMAQREFAMSAPHADRAAFARINSSAQSKTAEQALGQLLGAPQQLAAGPALAQSWYEDFGSRVHALDQLAVDVADRLVSQSKDQYDDAMHRAWIDAGVTTALLVTALGLAFAVSRSISRGLRRLHEAAIDVAEVRLPHLMRDLQDNPLAAVDLRVPPSGITTRDDIGDVAQAFDAVHREAVRLAGDQARLRESVSTLFRNLSHRNQGLVHRQLSILTALEQHEADAVQLKRLFELDHLAARMRRNSENLLVLAGGHSTSRAWRPMSLLDVVRTAMSEVEQFERVGHLAVPSVYVAGHAVSDVTHLLSELLENALMFSSPQTEVQVGGQQLPDGRILVEVRDHGIGIDAARLERVNGQLAADETLTADASQHMGLYVVGLLARRHGIEVSLRSVASGTSALVLLPQEIAVLSAQEEPGQGTEGPRPRVRPGQPGSEDPAAWESAVPPAPARPRRPPPHTTGSAVGEGASVREGTDGSRDAAPDSPAQPKESVPAPDGEPSAPLKLPRRVPMARLKPGSISPESDAPHQQEPAASFPAVSERLRSRLGALHEGIARADGEQAPSPSDGGQE